jgi:FMN reductase (NADPH)/FMN reductase [NAD(P)H]
MFALPQYVLPVTLVCFGYPTPEQAARQQPARFARQFIVHRNTYHRMEPAALEEMFAPLNARLLSTGSRKDGIQNVGQFNFINKFSAEFSVEMSRSVRAMIAGWTQKPQ